MVVYDRIFGSGRLKWFDAVSPQNGENSTQNKSAHIKEKDNGLNRDFVDQLRPEIVQSIRPESHEYGNWKQQHHRLLSPHTDTDVFQAQLYEKAFYNDSFNKQPQQECSFAFTDRHDQLRQQMIPKPQHFYQEFVNPMSVCLKPEANSYFGCFRGPGLVCKQKYNHCDNCLFQLYPRPKWHAPRVVLNRSFHHTTHSARYERGQSFQLHNYTNRSQRFIPFKELRSYPESYTPQYQQEKIMSMSQCPALKNTPEGIRLANQILQTRDRLLQNRSDKKNRTYKKKHTLLDTSAEHLHWAPEYGRGRFLESGTIRDDVTERVHYTSEYDKVTFSEIKSGDQSFFHTDAETVNVPRLRPHAYTCLYPAIEGHEQKTTRETKTVATQVSPTTHYALNTNTLPPEGRELVSSLTTKTLTNYKTTKDQVVTNKPPKAPKKTRSVVKGSFSDFFISKSFSKRPSSRLSCCSLRKSPLILKNNMPHKQSRLIHSLIKRRDRQTLIDLHREVIALGSKQKRTPFKLLKSRPMINLKIARPKSTHDSNCDSLAKTKKSIEFINTEEQINHIQCKNNDSQKQAMSTVGDTLLATIPTKASTKSNDLQLKCGETHGLMASICSSKSTGEGSSFTELYGLTPLSIRRGGSGSPTYNTAISLKEARVQRGCLSEPPWTSMTSRDKGSLAWTLPQHMEKHGDQVNVCLESKYEVESVHQQYIETKSNDSYASELSQHSYSNELATINSSIDSRNAIDATKAKLSRWSTLKTAKIYSSKGPKHGELRVKMKNPSRRCIMSAPFIVSKKIKGIRKERKSKSDQDCLSSKSLRKLLSGQSKLMNNVKNKKKRFRMFFRRPEKLITKPCTQKYESKNGIPNHSKMQATTQTTVIQSHTTLHKSMIPFKDMNELYRRFEPYHGDHNSSTTNASLDGTKSIKTNTFNDPFNIKGLELATQSITHTVGGKKLRRASSKSPARKVRHQPNKELKNLMHGNFETDSNEKCYLWSQQTTLKTKPGVKGSKAFITPITSPTIKHLKSPLVSLKIAKSRRSCTSLVESIISNSMEITPCPSRQGSEQLPPRPPPVKIKIKREPIFNSKIYYENQKEDSKRKKMQANQKIKIAERNYSPIPQTGVHTQIKSTWSSINANIRPIPRRTASSITRATTPDRSSINSQRSPVQVENVKVSVNLLKTVTSAQSNVITYQNQTPSLSALSYSVCNTSPGSIVKHTEGKSPHGFFQETPHTSPVITSKQNSYKTKAQSKCTRMPIEYTGLAFPPLKSPSKIISPTYVSTPMTATIVSRNDKDYTFENSVRRATRKTQFEHNNNKINHETSRTNMYIYHEDIPQHSFPVLAFTSEGKGQKKVDQKAQKINPSSVNHEPIKSCLPNKTKHEFMPCLLSKDNVDSKELQSRSISPRSSGSSTYETPNQSPLRSADPLTFNAICEVIKQIQEQRHKASLKNCSSVSPKSIDMVPQTHNIKPLASPVAQTKQTFFQNIPVSKLKEVNEFQTDSLPERDTPKKPIVIEENLEHNTTRDHQEAQGMHSVKDRQPRNHSEKECVTENHHSNMNGPAVHVNDSDINDASHHTNAQPSDSLILLVSTYSLPDSDLDEHEKDENLTSKDVTRPTLTTTNPGREPCVQTKDANEEETPHLKVVLPRHISECNTNQSLHNYSKEHEEEYTNNFSTSWGTEETKQLSSRSNDTLTLEDMSKIPLDDEKSPNLSISVLGFQETSTPVAGSPLSPTYRICNETNTTVKESHTEIREKLESSSIMNNRLPDDFSLITSMNSLNVSVSSDINSPEQLSREYTIEEPDTFNSNCEGKAGVDSSQMIKMKYVNVSAPTQTHTLQETSNSNNSELNAKIVLPKQKSVTKNKKAKDIFNISYKEFKKKLSKQKTETRTSQVNQKRAKQPVKNTHVRTQSLPPKPRPKKPAPLGLFRPSGGLTQCTSYSDWFRHAQGVTNVISRYNNTQRNNPDPHKTGSCDRAQNCACIINQTHCNDRNRSRSITKEKKRTHIINDIHKTLSKTKGSCDSINSFIPITKQTCSAHRIQATKSVTKGTDKNNSIGPTSKSLTKRITDQNQITPLIQITKSSGGVGSSHKVTKKRTRSSEATKNPKPLIHRANSCGQMAIPRTLSSEHSKEHKLSKEKKCPKNIIKPKKAESSRRSQIDLPVNKKAQTPDLTKRPHSTGIIQNSGRKLSKCSSSFNEIKQLNTIKTINNLHDGAKDKTKRLNSKNIDSSDYASAMQIKSKALTSDSEAKSRHSKQKEDKHAEREHGWKNV